MKTFELDAVDRGILHVLQRDARNNSPSAIADEVGVAPNTVRSRIERLEEQGILQGYYPWIDYELAGYQLRVVFVCSASIADRRRVADDALRIDGVIRVNETLSGHDNLLVEGVGEDTEAVTSIARQLEEIGCKIGDEWFIKSSRVKPFNHFGVEHTEE